MMCYVVSGEVKCTRVRPFLYAWKAGLGEGLWVPHPLRCFDGPQGSAGVTADPAVLCAGALVSWGPGGISALAKVTRDTSQQQVKSEQLLELTEERSRRRTDKSQRNTCRKQIYT